MSSECGPRRGNSDFMCTMQGTIEKDGVDKRRGRGRLDGCKRGQGEGVQEVQVSRGASPTPHHTTRSCLHSCSHRARKGLAWAGVHLHLPSERVAAPGYSVLPHTLPHPPHALPLCCPYCPLSPCAALHLAQPYPRAAPPDSAMPLVCPPLQ